MKKLAISVAVAASLAGCASAPPEDPPQIEPGVYLLMRGSERDLLDIGKMSKAMLRAGDFCARTNQKPEIILDAKGSQRIMAFRCGETGVWPPKSS